MTRSNSWTPEERALIVAGWNAGDSTDKILLSLPMRDPPRTKYALERRIVLLRNEGVPLALRGPGGALDPQALADVLIRIIQDRYENSLLSYSQIAATFGLTKGVVAGVIHRLRREGVVSASRKPGMLKAPKVPKPPAQWCGANLFTNDPRAVAETGFVTRIVPSTSLAWSSISSSAALAVRGGT